MSSLAFKSLIYKSLGELQGVPDSRNFVLLGNCSIEKLYYAGDSTRVSTGRDVPRDVPGQKKILVPVSLCPGTKKSVPLSRKVALSRPVGNPSANAGRVSPHCASSLQPTDLKSFYGYQWRGLFSPTNALKCKAENEIKH